jgi:hypothetical protein
MTTVRFHLLAGKNFMKWQVKKGKTVRYYDPNKFHLEMTDCKLRNYPSVALKIFKGKNKTVCAWIDCKNIMIYPANTKTISAKRTIRYNPRISPYWRSGNGRNIDNRHYDYIVSSGTQLFV